MNPGSPPAQKTGNNLNGEEKRFPDEKEENCRKKAGFEKVCFKEAGHKKIDSKKIGIKKRGAEK